MSGPVTSVARIEDVQIFMKGPVCIFEFYYVWDHRISSTNFGENFTKNPFSVVRQTYKEADSRFSQLFFCRTWERNETLHESVAPVAILCVTRGRASAFPNLIQTWTFILSVGLWSFVVVSCCTDLVCVYKGHVSINNIPLFIKHSGFMLRSKLIIMRL